MGSIAIGGGLFIPGAPLASPAFTGTPTAPTATAATNNTQIATTAYADSAVATAFAAFSPKSGCRMATTANLNATYLNGASGVGATLVNAGALAAFSVDGVSGASGNRVLVKNQSAPEQNGIYTLTTVGSGAVAWVLTRATDYDQASEIHEADYTEVTEGTANADTLWQMTQSATVVVGTTAITWAELLVAAQTVTESQLSFSDVTTADVSTTKHGLAPKAPGDATKFLNGANPPAWAVPAGALTLIATNTPSNAASSTFSSIPGSYSSLMIRYRLVSTVAATNDTLECLINNDSGSNYDRIYNGVFNGSSSLGVNYAMSYADIANIPAANATSGSVGTGEMWIEGYADTSYRHNWESRSASFTTDGSESRGYDSKGQYRSTTAITSLVFKSAGGNITGTIWLYGVSA